MKTLIVDDDLSSLRLVRKLLERHGECNSATNGREVLEALITALEISRPYYLICLDTTMQGMDGLTAIRGIRGVEEIMGIFPPMG